MRSPPRSLPLPPPAAAPAARVPAPERLTLPNGLRVVAIPRPGLPQVAMRLSLRAGAVADPAGFAGAAALVGAMLTEGTAKHTAEELNARLDLLGASLGVHVGHDWVDIDLALLAETVAPGVALLAELVTRPSFPERELARVRAESLDALEGRDDEPANVADDRAARELFGAHPYGRLAAGTLEGIGAVPREALAAFHEARYRPESGFLVAAGRFETGALVRALESAFGGWAGAGPAPESPPQPAVPARAGELVHVAWPDAAQGEVRITGIGMERRAPEWIPAAVANYILGGSTITGRLGANLREEKGWTYGVRSGFSAGWQRGAWAVETAVEAEVTAAAVAEILAELERFCREPVSGEELRRAKDAMVLSLPRAFESPARIVGRFATLDAYDLPHDYWERFPAAVEAVTTDDVLRVGRRFFAPERLVRVVVGGSAS